MPHIAVACAQTVATRKYLKPILYFAILSSSKVKYSKGKEWKEYKIYLRGLSSRTAIIETLLAIYNVHKWIPFSVNISIYSMWVTICVDWKTTLLLSSSMDDVHYRNINKSLQILLLHRCTSNTNLWCVSSIVSTPINVHNSFND